MTPLSASTVMSESGAYPGGNPSGVPVTTNILNDARFTAAAATARNAGQRPESAAYSVTSAIASSDTRNGAIRRVATSSTIAVAHIGGTDIHTAMLSSARHDTTSPATENAN